MAGQMVHVEIPAGDTAKARSSGAASSAGSSRSTRARPTEYHMTRFSDTQGGAIMGAEDDKRGPRVYFDVDDINAANARVGELGGTSGEALPGAEHGLVRGLRGHRGQRVRALAERRERARRLSPLARGGGEPSSRASARPLEPN